MNISKNFNTSLCDKQETKAFFKENINGNNLSELLRIKIHNLKVNSLLSTKNMKLATSHIDILNIVFVLLAPSGCCVDKSFCLVKFLSDKHLIFR